MSVLPLLLVFSVQATPANRTDDSVRIHRAAQAAQARFERRRLDFLPWYDGASSDPCDELIGRYCFRYGDRNALYEPPPDSEPLVRIRDQLIAELGDASRALPGDEWIAGQRIRYLVEAKRTDGAVTAAATCRPPGTWWCLALLGYAHHGAGEYAEADTAYAAALAVMPLEERCRWTDLSPLLDRSPSGYRRLPCEARDSIERRFWWLADPLYLIPGNERRTEHYSRWVINRLQASAVSPWGYSWADDLRQILIRFGWPAGWSRPRQSAAGFADAWAVAASFREPERAFEPPARYVEDPSTIDAGTWTLIPERPRGGYVPAYAARLDSLPSQVAVFRRGGRAVVVAGYDLTQDSVPADMRVRAALSLAAGPDVPARTAADDRARARGVLSLDAPAGSGLLSVEALATGGRRAARQRYWLAPAPLPDGRPAVSDLLLLARSDSLPQTLEAATPLTLPSGVLLPAIVGLYWEVYGLGPGATPYSVALTVVRESAGFFRRAARALGLGGAEHPQVRVGWDDASQPGSGTSGTSLALDLSGAKPGRYTIRLMVLAAGDSAVTERQITIK